MRTMSSLFAKQTFLNTALLVGMMAVVSTAAMAQQAGLAHTTQNIALNVRTSVPFIPMLSYVVGVFFAAAGLLKLKDWVNDGERNSIVPAIGRLMIASALIILPHVIRMTNGTFFGQTNGVLPVAQSTQLRAFCKSNNPNCN